MKDEIFYIIEVFLYTFVFIFFYRYYNAFLTLKAKYTNYLPYPIIIIKILFFNIDYFINLKEPITAESFRYLLENDQLNLFKKYQNLIPNNTPTFYHTLLPFHANGLLKSQADFRSLFSLNNINIKHFSLFLHHGDKHEYEKSSFLIQSLNGPTKTINTKFTIVYCSTISRPSAQLIREIEALYHEEAAFIILYDNKSNRTVLYELFENQLNNYKFKNVYIIDSPRFYVEWGRITQAFTEIVMN